MAIFCFLFFSYRLNAIITPHLLIINDKELKEVFEANNLLLNKDINVRKELKAKIQKESKMEDETCQIQQ